MTSLLRHVALGFMIIAVSLGIGVSIGDTASAAEGEFYLQVSPSPLVATLKPGETTTLELKVRNAGTKQETLKIQPRSFTINNTSGEVEFNDTAVPEVSDWLQFSAPTFTVGPGQSYNEKVVITVPKDAGFSYSFALLITREGNETMNSAGQQLKGQVAVFALLNIDRPGAVRQLAIESVSTEHGVYEFLPAKVNVRVKNTGNTIVQPAGDVFIQRGSNDAIPIDTMAVNKTSGYILPGAVRTLSTQWDNGFLVNRKAADGSEQLDWNWSNIGNIRMGYYTAKIVAIYNDGQRDIPVSGEVGFWVIPWRALLVVLAVVALLAAGLWTIVRKMTRVASRTGGKITLAKKKKR